MTASTREQVYRALAHAAERIGAHNYATGNGVVTVKHGRRKVRRYSPTTAHRRVMEAMLAVMDGTLSTDDAMGVLWEWDVMLERGMTP